MKINCVDHCRYLRLLLLQPLGLKNKLLFGCVLPPQPSVSKAKSLFCSMSLSVHLSPRLVFPNADALQIDRALDERTIGHNPERLNLMKVTSLAMGHAYHSMMRHAVMGHACR